MRTLVDSATSMTRSVAPASRRMRAVCALLRGNPNGALQVSLGGIDATQVLGMSGGWRRTFTLAQAGVARVSVGYNLTQTEPRLRIRRAQPSPRDHRRDV